MNIKQALLRASRELEENKVSEPEKSAEFLLRQALGSQSDTRCGIEWDKAKLLANPDYELSLAQEKKFREFIERRRKHEPVWYITGKIEFYGLDLEVNENVLIPRPETEFLVEEVVAVIPAEAGIQSNHIKILELGTGSGAITLALASEVRSSKSDVQFFASDIVEEALKIAKKNAKKLRLEKDIEFRQSDLLDNWDGEKFDIIVANLPYIPHEDLSFLALDIHRWEPRVALDGGKEGLEIYARLLLQAKDYLNENYQMFFEIGIDQGEKLKKLAEKYLPGSEVEIKKDYGDIDRIAIISFKKA